VHTWSNSETFAHGFVVPPIVLWLAWRQRAALARITPQPQWAGVAVIALAGGAWLLGRLAEVNALAQFAMTAMIVAAVPAVLGVRVARALLFPLAFLFFAVPFGDFVLPLLMDWTANFTVAALRASGIPVYREGLVFVIPSGTWSVVEACSGVRYLIASLMVGTLYAYLSYRSNRRRWIFVGFAFLVPIAANWVRAYLIVLLGHVSGNKLAVGVDHLIYGWLFFAFVIMLMFWIGGRWREDPLPATATGGGTAAATSGLADDECAVASAPVRVSRFWAVAVASMLVAALFAVVQARFDAADAAGPVSLAPITPASGWAVGAGGLSDWRPVFERASATFDGHFIRGNAAVGVYIAYYRDQDASRKVVSSSNVLVHSEDRFWRRVSQGTTGEIAFGAAPVDMTTAELVHGSERIVAWKLYWIDGKLTSSDARAKLLTAWARLRGGVDDSAAVIVYAHADSAAAAAPLLQAFARDEGASIAAALAATREHR
jgi:exosortase A